MILKVTPKKIKLSQNSAEWPPMGEEGGKTKEVVHTASGGSWVLVYFNF